MRKFFAENLSPESEFLVRKLPASAGKREVFGSLTLRMSGSSPQGWKEFTKKNRGFLAFRPKMSYIRRTAFEARARFSGQCTCYFPIVNSPKLLTSKGLGNRDETRWGQ